MPVTPLRAAVVAVGSELVFGDGIDTNSAWLSRRLRGLGLDPRLHLSCPDDLEAIVEGLEHAAGKAEVVVVTGGLGPTRDDLTREAVAHFLGVPLVEHAPSLEHIAALFARFGREMSPSNARQAQLPEGARVLVNEVGTAPAFAVERGPLLLYSLPGVPREMRWLWDRHLAAELRARSPVAALAERTFRTCEVSESKLGELLRPLEEQPDLEVRYAAEESLGTIRVTILTAGGEDRAQEAWRQADELVGAYVCAHGQDELAEALVALLRARKLTVATAESCTGGRVAAALTAIPGASAVFLEGMVTYSNEAKARQLGVPLELIEAHGAVSPEVARAMARGARRFADADLGLGVTGIAGPGGERPGKPVGLVYLAVAGPGEDEVQSIERRYPGDRQLVQIRAAAGALNLIRRQLEARSG